MPSPPSGRRRRLPVVLLAAAAIAASQTTTARAQMVVYDPSAYAKLIEQAQTAMAQLEQLKSQVAQAERLYDALNHPSDVGGLAAGLLSPALRQLLPEAAAFADAARDDLAALGRIGAQAAQIRQATRAYTPETLDELGQALERTGNRLARDLALGQAVADAGAQRLDGLQALQGAIGSAAPARAVMDLQARLAVEQAIIANDQTRLQGLAMAQAAEAELEVQRRRERSAAARDARLQTYRQAFQGS